MKFIRNIAIFLGLLLVTSASQAATVDPGDFNVYSLGDIGMASHVYGSDFQGVTGAAGDVYFGGFTLTGLNKVDGYVLFTGGSASLNGGDFLGSIDVGGNVTLQSFSVAGDVRSGGTVSANGGTISGSVTQGASPTLVDHAAMSRYFLDTSAAIAAMSNTGTITNNWGGLSYTASSGVNVLTIDANSLKNAWGFTLTGPSDAVVYINVTGTDVTMDWLDWAFAGGVGADDVLLNYNQAQTFTLNQGGTTNILAPNADMTYTSGVFSGSIVAGNLYGNGQVNLGGFSHYDPIPEPATMSLLALGGIAIFARKRNLR